MISPSNSRTALAAIALWLMLVCPAMASDSLLVPPPKPKPGDFCVVGHDGVLRCGASPPAIVGQARVIDGDTIDLAGTRIRLYGIDAPERAQTCEGDAGVYECGRDASATLTALLRGRDVSCEKRDIDRYGRTVAQCSTDAGDIGAAMVESGWAVDYARYSGGLYAAQEAEAREARRGIWSGRFDVPSDWRRQHKGRR